VGIDEGRATGHELLQTVYVPYVIFIVPSDIGELLHRLTLIITCYAVFHCFAVDMDTRRSMCSVRPEKQSSPSFLRAQTILGFTKFLQNY